MSLLPLFRVGYGPASHNCILLKSSSHLAQHHRLNMLSQPSLVFCVVGQSFVSWSPNYRNRLGMTSFTIETSIQHFFGLWFSATSPDHSVRCIAPGYAFVKRRPATFPLRAFHFVFVTSQDMKGKMT